MSIRTGSPTRFGWMILVLSAVMLLGALAALLSVAEAQEPPPLPEWPELPLPTPTPTPTPGAEGSGAQEQGEALPDPPLPTFVSLTWNSSARTATATWNVIDGIDWYGLGWKRPGAPNGTSGTLAAASSATQSYTATQDLECGHTYTFILVAYGDGEKYAAEWSSFASRDLSTACPPPTPTGLEVTGTTQSSVSLDWDDKTGVSKYRVRYGQVTRETPNSSYRVPGLSSGTTYTFRVSAYGDGSTYEAAWGSDATIRASTREPTIAPPPPPPISVTVTALSTTVEEGTAARFTVTLSRAPATRLVVNLWASAQEGAFIATGETGRKTATFIAPNASKEVRVGTDDDMLDELPGKVRLSVQAGSGYKIGDPAFADVTVTDDEDKPPTPENVRVNGHLTGKNITLRWKPVTGARSYNVYYTLCEDGLTASCTPTTWEDEEAIQHSYHAPSASRQADLPIGSGSAGHLYQVVVTAKIAEESRWVYDTLVYPTTAPLTTQPTVATIPVRDYQSGANFTYSICAPANPPDPMVSDDPHQLPVAVSEIKRVVALYAAGVPWKKSTAGNPNIISVTSNGSMSTCRDTDDPNARSSNVVYFYGGDHFEELCGKPETQIDGCWTGQRVSMGQAMPQSIVLAASKNWAGNTLVGCKLLELVLQHEVGHAFGIGHAAGTGALMSAKPGACSPTARDRAATMANYQSR